MIYGAGDVRVENGGLVRTVFIVQGCDSGTFSSDCGPWSIATSVKVPY
ncbi:hypothetical protein LDL08_32585 [Nonomuraea glycinis]|uniref:Uncharacterized protein n=1 Tax=Nonomuraea glycinis TaxID=2047744 RepID=A0A918AA97_9ACTN|nr:hypothetical protein [Nonomuraea glycinis]MCA2180928.1 hypothetical protein [Nonomuraea glycinis]GGP13036.1 hypothetical protein GCM10012278_63210 [Nonomuraea glycinis]